MHKRHGESKPRFFLSAKRQQTPQSGLDFRNPAYTAYEVLTFMRGETKERWETLCEQAAVEQNPERLVELTAEITRLLEEKEKRLTGQKIDQQTGGYIG